MLKTQHVPSRSLGQGAVGVTCDAIVPTEISLHHPSVLRGLGDLHPLAAALAALAVRVHGRRQWIHRVAPLALGQRGMRCGSRLGHGEKGLGWPEKSEKYHLAWIKMDQISRFDFLGADNL